jgi:hypothetical protein
MLSTFERCCPSNGTEANKKLCIKHLGAFQKQFSLYFKDVDISKFERIRHPFAANNASGLTISVQEQLIDISLKGFFDADKLIQFQLPVKKEYP